MTAAEARPAVGTCPQCGMVAKPASWLLCIPCAASYSPEMLAEVEHVRDYLRDWLAEAWAVLRTIPKGDSKRLKGERKWRRTWRNWRTLRWMTLS
jgi:NMD protein affecting ribosome stability and mRNA decay